MSSIVQNPEKSVKITSGCVKCVNSILVQMIQPFLGKHTVFENHKKSIIQHCERSEQGLHFAENAEIDPF